MLPCGLYKIFYISKKSFRILLIKIITQKNPCTVERKPFGISHVPIHHVMVIIGPEIPIIDRIRLRIIKPSQ